MTTSYSNATSLNSSSSATPTSYKTTAEPRIQNVTKQIERIHRIYGASDYTSPNRHAAGVTELCQRCFNSAGRE